MSGIVEWYNYVLAGYFVGGTINVLGVFVSGIIMSLGYL